MFTNRDICVLQGDFSTPESLQLLYTMFERSLSKPEADSDSIVEAATEATLAGLSSALEHDSPRVHEILQQLAETVKHTLLHSHRSIG